jgi:hypothetical protein
VLEPEGFGTAYRLEQELQNFDMSFGFSERLAPRIESVPAEEQGAHIGIPAQRYIDCTRQPFHVLIILQDRDPLPVLVAGHAAQPLEHFVSIDTQAAGSGMEIREQRTPHGVRVQDGPGTADARDREVQACFRRGASGSSSDGGTPQVDGDDVRGTQGAFVASACGNREPERTTRHDGAEVAAGAERPSAGIEPVARFGECPGEFARTAVHRSGPW